MKRVAEVARVMTEGSNGIFIPNADLSILLFYTHERFRLQKNAKSEETNCCLSLI